MKLTACWMIALKIRRLHCWIGWMLGLFFYTFILWNYVQEFIIRLFQMRSLPSSDSDIGTQLTMVSATLPTSLSEILEEIIDVRKHNCQKFDVFYLSFLNWWFCNSLMSLSTDFQVDNLETITTDRLHFIMPHITHVFMRTGRTSKPSFFLDLIKKDFRKKKPSIIFWWILFLYWNSKTFPNISSPYLFIYLILVIIMKHQFGWTHF